MRDASDAASSAGDAADHGATAVTTEVSDSYISVAGAYLGAWV